MTTNATFLREFLCDNVNKDFVSYFSQRIEQTFPNAEEYLMREKADFAAFCDADKEKNREIKKLVNDILQYNAYKTNKAYSNNMKAEHIAHTFSSMFQDKHLSGPIAFTLCVPSKKLSDVFERECPVIVLIGDKHEGEEKCNKPDVSLYDGSFLSALNNFVKEHNIVTDLFIENWGDKGRSMPTKDRSSLSHTHNYLQWCYGKLKNDKCPVRNLRTHYADPRTNEKDIDSIWFMIYDSSTYSDLEARLKRSFPLLSAKQIYELVCIRLRFGTYKFCKYMLTNKNEFFKTYSNVMKEIMQLPDHMQRYLFTKYNKYENHYMITEDAAVLLSEQPLDLAIDHSNRDQEFQTIKTTISKFLDTTKRISYIYWFGFTSTLDMYFLSRALKSPIGNLPSQLSILYAGNMHINHLLYFLTYQTQFYSIFRISSSISNKCVSMTNLTQYAMQILTKRLSIKDTYMWTHAFFSSFLSTALSNNLLSDKHIKELVEFLSRPKSCDILNELLFYDELISGYMSEVFDIYKDSVVDLDISASALKMNTQLIDMFKLHKELKSLLFKNKRYFESYFKNSSTILKLIADKVELTETWQLLKVEENKELFIDNNQYLSYINTYKK